MPGLRAGVNPSCSICLNNGPGGGRPTWGIGRKGRWFYFVFLFFQAEDGIRDLTVTGVQTCALPIYNSTGIVDVVPVYDGKAAVSQTVTRYFLTHYVTICERFNFATAESDYEECGAFHGVQRNQAWYALWNPNNPASPLNVHKDGSAVRAQVESVSFFQRGSGVSDLAQVRYLKAERQPGAADERFTHWIATIQYAYTAPPKDPRVRRWNPLGFRIVELTSEPEVLGQPASGKSR